jgi:hypothetical protein
MSPDDVKANREAHVNIARLVTMMEEVQKMTVDNHQTLRGHNGDPGMVAEFTALRQQVAEMATCLDNLKEVPNDLATLKGQINALKDVPAEIEVMKRYRPLTWLVVHKFKHFAVITAAAVVTTITFGFPNSYSSEKLQALIELIVSKWLRL